ncbi:uncharacterized protein LOC141820784 [Curcuma longa]|uniref:uncharacterized protein LOC141820784 n=1 Tax=Curcuma longa TaxID=136217 RepID=UPI003D9DFB9D
MKCRAEDYAALAPPVVSSYDFTSVMMIQHLGRAIGMFYFSKPPHDEPTSMFSSLMMLMIGYLLSPCSPLWNFPHHKFHVTTFNYCVSALCPILHTLDGVLHHLGPACFLLSI